MATHERKLTTIPGFAGAAGVLVVLSVAAALFWAAFTGPEPSAVPVVAAVLLSLAGLVAVHGFVIVQPNQAKVAIFLGRYAGTVRTAGFHWVNPLTIRRHVSLRIRNLDTDGLKVNDANGNPIEISAVITWQVRGADQVIATLHDDLQARLDVAGVAVFDTRLRRLAFAPELAADMLRRQQANAVVAARQRIVEGAVGMVDHALSSLSERGIVELDEERKAAMVSNLMVVLVSDRGAQPVVNSGSLYT